MRRVSQVHAYRMNLCLSEALKSCVLLPILALFRCIGR
jgi:hypothetical protein